MSSDIPTEAKAHRRVQDLYARKDGKISDKWASYLDFYEEIFSPRRDRPLRILEIGIQNGGSLETWAHYFSRAEHILGCDIAPAAAGLRFSDPRIQVIVGDANGSETFARVQAVSDQFDLIIDDGSHRSGDIIRSFALYFPLLSEGGIYVAEDLHCSYWREFQGGLEAPFAAMTFFKRFADLVNREHWGGPLDSDAILQYFSEVYGAKFDSTSLDRVTEVRFRNSICAVTKGGTDANLIGLRIVAGAEAPVEPRTNPGLNGTAFKGNDQVDSPFGPFARRLEALAAGVPELERDRLVLAAQITALQEEARLADAEAKMTKEQAICSEERARKLAAALVSARRYPLAALRDKLAFKLLKVLAKASPPLSSRTAARFGRSAAKRDPRRGAGENI